MDVWSVFRCEKECLCSHPGWWLQSSIPASWHCTLALGPGKGLRKAAWTYIPSGLGLTASCQCFCLQPTKPACHSLLAPLRQTRPTFPLLLAAVVAETSVLVVDASPWHAPPGQGVVRFLPSLGGKTGCRMVCWRLQPRQCGWRACVGRVGKPYKQET